jgi:hypothetical protein
MMFDLPDGCCKWVRNTLTPGIVAEGEDDEVGEDDDE